MRVAQQNTIEVIIIYCGASVTKTNSLYVQIYLAIKLILILIISNAVNTGCCAVRQISDRKLLPRSIYDVLTQISNDFSTVALIQCRQTLAAAAHRVRCRHVLSCVHTTSDFIAACPQGLVMRSLVGVLATGCLDSKLGFLPLHTNILEAKY